jgi:hypothetical protein
LTLARRWPWPLSAQDGLLLTQGQDLHYELATGQQEQAEDTIDHAKQSHAGSSTPDYSLQWSSGRRMRSSDDVWVKQGLLGRVRLQGEVTPEECQAS